MRQKSDLVLVDNFENRINRKIWTLERIHPHSWKISEEQSYEGRSSVKITVNEGDKQEIGNDGKFTERAELKEAKSVQIRINTNIWYSFFFYMPKSFPINDNRLVIAQWKQETKVPKRSPFLSFRYRNGELIFQTIFEEKRYKYRKKIDLRCSWHRILLNYRLKKNLTGYAKAWLDDYLLGNYRGSLGYKYKGETIYFKMGLYRDILKEPQTIYIDRFRRSSKKKDVL